MKLKNSLGLAVVVLILGGCSTTLQDIDAQPVHESFVVNDTLENLYHRLTTTNSNELACGAVMKSNIYPERQEFRIYYGTNFPSLLGNIQAVNNALFAKAVEGGTAIDLKKTTAVMTHERLTRQLTNFVKTGRCE